MRNKRVIHLIAAARPNFMKVAPLIHALSKESWCRPVLIHTGQHYDANMSDAFFADLSLPHPDFHLGIGSGSHAEQTGGVMIAYEKVCLDNRPSLSIVVGDVNSTMACAITAKKLGIPVAHLEAGLRSGDWSMPEEVNRVVTDCISDVLWTPSSDADENLRREGASEDRIVRVGNIMIDSFELMRPAIEAAASHQSMGQEAGTYGVVTLHRPSNVDDEDALSRLVGQLMLVAERLPLVFTVHPRTRTRLEAFGLLCSLEEAPGITLAPPMGYVEFMGLVVRARLVITDSGGLQEETTYLGIPCLTMRPNTERPITIELGTNRLLNPDRLLASVQEVLSGNWPTGRCPELWDGKTAQRIADHLRAHFGRQAGSAPSSRPKVH